jgi:hypothetical protein
LVKLSHDEWEHARILLNPPCACCEDREIDRKDALLAIWRSVERRIRLLEDEYSLDKIPGAVEKVPQAKNRANKKAQLELLEELGLVRGSVLSAIRQLRNEMMHGGSVHAVGSPVDSVPENTPDRERCLLYHDMVWYFLRSTEHLARRQVDSYFLSNDPLSNPEPITIELAPPKWDVSISECNIQAELVSYNERSSWIPVFVGSVDPGGSYEYGYCYPSSDKGMMRLMGCVDAEWSLEFAKKSFTAV